MRLAGRIRYEFDKGDGGSGRRIVSRDRAAEDDKVVQGRRQRSDQGGAFGISFTVVNVKKNLVSVCLIPHTVQVTNFKTKKIGDKINIETDILGKYILKQT